MSAGRLSRLEAAVLGLLADAPAHGYALRARLGPGLPRERQINDGVLYPLLTRLERRGLLTAAGEQPAAGRRARKVYAATAEGEAAFLDWLRSGRDEDEPVGSAFFLDHPFLKLFFAARLTRAEREAKLDRIEAAAHERLAALDRIPGEAVGGVGTVVLDVARERERAVLAGVARLRA